MKRKLAPSRAVPRRRARHPAFTLVELLVVIAIIAILAALLFPVLSRAKAAAQHARCASNLRQLGLALHAYVDDFQKYPVYEDLPPYPMAVFWQDKVLTYAANSKAVFICPSDFTTNALNNWTFLDQEGYHGPNRSYGYNAAGSFPFFDNRGGVSFPLLGLDGDPFSSPIVRPLPEALVVAPADMIALADYDPVTPPIIPDPDNDGDIWGDPAPAASLWDALRGRHSSGANVVFCDAHVEFAKTNQWTAMTDSTRCRWNHDHTVHLQVN